MIISVSTLANGQANIKPEINWELTFPGMEVFPPRMSAAINSNCVFIAMFFYVTFVPKSYRLFSNGSIGLIFERAIENQKWMGQELKQSLEP